jgi:tRNA threonylcarbamoyladenosine biosynthesis protein TsaB
MLILSADTSGKEGSIALARCDQDGSCEILEMVSLLGGTFSAQLVPQIAGLLSKHGFNKRDIDGFAVVSGPGSFTGLRVGLAAIKALAEVLNKPIAAVSLLEALAVAGRPAGKIMAALDAGRNQIYAGIYEIHETAKMVSEQLQTRDEFLASAAGWQTVTSDSSIAEVARAAGLQVSVIDRPASDVIARLGWSKILAGETVAPENLEANYIRRSDAEIFAKPGM